MTQPLAPPHNIKGACTALVTPMNDDGVDEAAFVALVSWQIDEGIHGLVPCGTTGESPTLSHDEHRHVIELCVKEAAGRVPVIAGCGSNSTDEAIDLVCHGEKVGADAALVVTPYYNKPSQEGLYEHFAAVARASSLPLIIYNIPGRCVVDMSVETMMRLATDFPTIVGVKDSSCDLMRPLSYRAHNLAREGGDFIQLSGEDGTALAFMAQGGMGCISVASNVAPSLCAEMFELWWAGDVQEAMLLNEHLCVLYEALFLEGNPAPTKCALHLMGKCENKLRLPLVSVSEETEQKIAVVLQSLQLFP